MTRSSSASEAETSGRDSGSGARASSSTTASAPAPAGVAVSKYCLEIAPDARERGAEHGCVAAQQREARHLQLQLQAAGQQARRFVGQQRRGRLIRAPHADDAQEGGAQRLQSRARGRSRPPGGCRGRGIEARRRGLLARQACRAYRARVASFSTSPSVSTRGTARSAVISPARSLRTGVRRGSAASRRCWSAICERGQRAGAVAREALLGIGDAHEVFGLFQQPDEAHPLAARHLRHGVLEARDAPGERILRPHPRRRSSASRRSRSSCSRWMRSSSALSRRWVFASSSARPRSAGVRPAIPNHCAAVPASASTASTSASRPPRGAARFSWRLIGLSGRSWAATARAAGIPSFCHGSGAGFLSRQRVSSQ